MTDRHFDKKAWRDLNLDFIQGVTQCENQKLLVNGKLQGMALDLAGEDTVEIFQSYTARGLLRNPSDLVLVDVDTCTSIKGRLRLAKRYKKRDRPLCVLGDVYNLIPILNNRPSSIGVYCMDLMNQAGAPWWDRDGGTLFAQVMHSVQQFGVSCLILNHTLDGLDTHEDRLTRLVEHVHSFERVLRVTYGSTSPMSPILPSDAALLSFLKSPPSEVNDEGRWLGGVQVYRSRTWRMVTIRVYLLTGGPVVYRRS